MSTKTYSRWRPSAVASNCPGYNLAGIQAAYSAILTQRDHPSRFAAADFFYSGDDCSLEAARIFAALAMDHIGKLGMSAHWDDIGALLERIDRIR